MIPRLRLAAALLLAGLLCVSYGRAQFIGEGVWKSVKASYAGPGDVVGSASVYWSCTLAYTAAYASGGNNACDLIRASDSATCTAKFGSNGIVDISVGTPCSGATVTSFCNGTTCSITQAYDQATANTNPGIPATSAFDPVFTFSGVGTCPTTTYIAANQSDLRDLSFTHAQPYTVVTIARTTSTAGSGGLGGDAGSYLINQTGNNVFASTGGAGSISVTISQNTIYALEAVFNGNSNASSITVNGSTTVGNVDVNSINGIQVGRSFDGDALLSGIWPVAFNGTQIANMNSNLRAKCGGF